MDVLKNISKTPFVSYGLLKNILCTISTISLNISISLFKTSCVNYKCLKDTRRLLNVMDVRVSLKNYACLKNTTGTSKNQTFSKYSSLDAQSTTFTHPNKAADG